MNKCILILSLVFTLFSCGKKVMPTENAKASKEIEGLELSELQMQLGHIETDTITDKALGDELILTGVLTTNQSTLNSVSSKVMGRIEKLYFKNVAEEIKVGQPMYDIYSEDLNLAAKELKLAIEKKSLMPNDLIDMGRIIKSARRKLSLYGLSANQIQNIENSVNFSNTFTMLSPVSGVISGIVIREGDYVMEGGGIFQIADLSMLWAEAQVYSDNIAQINENMNATIYFPGIPGLQRTGRIIFVNPEFSQSSTINLVRIEVPNYDRELKPGMQINVSVLLNKSTVLALPTDAIILNGKGASVWVKTGHYQFKNVMVVTGIETNEYTEIKSGVKRGDVIVTSGAYLLSSEYLFRKGSNPMEGHDMKTK